MLKLLEENLHWTLGETLNKKKIQHLRVSRFNKMFFLVYHRNYKSYRFIYSSKLGVVPTFLQSVL